MKAAAAQTDEVRHHRAGSGRPNAEGRPVTGGNGQRHSAACVDAQPILGSNKKWVIALGTAACYVLFTVAVHLRLLDSLDLAVGRAARPGGVWGETQTRAGRVVEQLQPMHFSIAAVVFAGLLSVLRRSFRPMLVMTSVGIPTCLITLGTKSVMSHWDPGAIPVAHSSFPSGHAVTAIIVVGLLVLLVRPQTRWGWLLPAVMGAAIGSALILASVHPATDVLGAALLAGCVLTCAHTVQLGQWACVRQGR
jgi:undecaprenyl-diphosphatase